MPGDDWLNRLRDFRRGDAAVDRYEVQPGLLPTVIAGHRQRRLAAVVITLSVIAFIAAVPFAQVRLVPVPAFIPAYEAALVTLDVITAVLLFGQYGQLRSAALLALAAGYLYDGLLVIPHALSFPGLLTPTGWLGAGAQTTAWLYMFWHGGFPIFVMAYAGLERRAARHKAPDLGGSAPVVVTVAVVCIAIVLTLLATRAHTLLPEIMAGNSYTPAMTLVVGTVWTLSAAALLALLLNRPYSLLDLWLVVVMVAWLCDIALSAVLNAGRFDLGFYAGRLYGLLAVSFVLAIILLETSGLHGHLARATAQLRAYARELDRRAESAETLLRRVFETSLDLIVVTDRSGTLLRVSPSAVPLLGYDPNELVGRSGEILVHSDDIEATRDEMRIARRRGTTQNFECRYVRKDGGIVTLWWKGAWSAAEQQHFFIGRDISERQATERRLRDSEERLQRSQRLANIGSIHVNLKTEELEWSDQTYRIFGLSRAAFVPSMANYLSMVHPDHRVAVSAMQEQVRQGINPNPMEYRIVRPDGSIRQLYRESEIIRDEADKPLYVQSTLQDITERRQIEDQLRQAQKMEAVGTLTGGLAHDFNNHLGVIILNLDVLRERLTDSESEELIGEAIAAAMRGAELIRRLLAFARRQPLQPQRTEINRLVSEMTKLLDRTLGEDIKITLELDDAVWPTVIDRAQLESALANLATNARDAMPNGGELTIATGNRRLDEDYASQHNEVTPGDYALIEVSDTGIGMSPEVLAQVFEPFFTTKTTGRGTGLGLSMVYGFIKQSGGHINIYSELGVGTTIRLYLPRTGAEAAASGEAAPQALVRGGGETVLAVEDNPSLRRVVVRQLGELGYRVIEAGYGEEALEVLQTQPVALLFTDVVLPGGMSGYELTRTALSRWPAIKVVLTSGFPENRIGNGTSSPNIKLLSKPYRKEDLARVIRQVLGESGA